MEQEKNFDFDIPSDPSSADTREATTSIKYKDHLKDKYTGYIIPKNVKIKNVSNSPDNIFYKANAIISCSKSYNMTL